MLGDAPNMNSVHASDEDAVPASLREFGDH